MDYDVVCTLCSRQGVASSVLSKKFVEIAEWIDCRLLGRLLVRICCLPKVTPSACTLKVSRRRLLCLLNGQLQHLRFGPHEFVEKR